MAYEKQGGPRWAGCQLARRGPPVHGGDLCGSRTECRVSNGSRVDMGDGGYRAWATANELRRAAWAFVVIAPITAGQRHGNTLCVRDKTELAIFYFTTDAAWQPRESNSLYH